MRLWPSTVEAAEKCARGTRLVGRIVIVLAASFATVMQFLYARQVVDWSPWWVLIPLAITIAGSLGDVIWTARGQATRSGRSAKLDAIRQTLGNLVVEIHAETGVPFEIVGVSVWVPRSYRPWLRSPRLHRVLRTRLSWFPPPSSVDWTKGKGAIGRCWERNRQVYQPWIELNSRILDEQGPAISEQEWVSLSDEEKFGLSLNEFETLVGKYTEVLAVPIPDRRGRLVGVVSVDVPCPPAGVSRSYVLDGEPVQVQTKTAARIIAELVRGL